MNRPSVPGNTHYQAAEGRLDLINTGPYAKREDLLSEAQAEAALAVAYEHRTASLIAFYAAGPIPGDSAAAWSRIRDEITRRLSIKE